MAMRLHIFQKIIVSVTDLNRGQFKQADTSLCAPHVPVEPLESRSLFSQLLSTLAKLAMTNSPTGLRICLKRDRTETAVRKPCEPGLRNPVGDAAP